MSPLLNYTTTIAASKTIGQIHGMLVAAGAREVATTYDPEGEPDSIVFAVMTAYGRRTFGLPINAESVQKVLTRERVAPKFRTPEQASRVAWRILKDWVEAQLAIIRTEMVTLDQVMLPYMRNDAGVTVYDLYRDQQLALGPGAPS